jgi:UDP-N-acetylglucosamine 2-epimerase
VNNTGPVVIFGTKSARNNNFLYVKEEDFQILAGAQSFGIPLEHLKKIEKSKIHSKTILEHFSYDDFSFWWFLHPTIYPKFKKAINFIERFQEFLDNENPSKIIISKNFENFDIIKQICFQKNIPLIKNNINYFKHVILDIGKNNLQSKRYHKIFNKKTQKRKSLFYKKSKNIPNITNKILFVIPTIYHRKIIDNKTRHSVYGEYIQQSIIDHINTNNDIVGFDVDYTFNGDFNVLKSRLDSKIDWVPMELIQSNNSKNKYDDFINQYSKIISNKDFQNLFQFNNISLWHTLSSVFKMLTYTPYIPSYVNFLHSIDDYFKKNKPKFIFLSYETGPYALAIIIAAQKNQIKTIGVAHATIDKFNPMYSYDQIRDTTNPLGFPIPDTTLVHGEFSKNTLLNQGYPSNKIIVYGNPIFFNLNQLKNSLENKNLFKKYDIKKNQKVILYGTEFLQEYYSAQGKFNYNSLIWKNLLENFGNNHDYVLILKPHPNENTSVYEKILQKSSVTNAKIINDDLFELIHISSLVISVFSNIMTDALCFEKPVIRVTFDDIEHTVPYEKFNVVLSSNLDNLKLNIHKIIDDKNLLNMLQKNLFEFLQDQNNITEQEPNSIIDKIIE